MINNPFVTENEIFCDEFSIVVLHRRRDYKGMRETETLSSQFMKIIHHLYTSQQKIIYRTSYTKHRLLTQ